MADEQDRLRNAGYFFSNRGKVMVNNYGEGIVLWLTDADEQLLERFRELVGAGTVAPPRPGKSLYRYTARGADADHVLRRIGSHVAGFDVHFPEKVREARAKAAERPPTEDETVDVSIPTRIEPPEDPAASLAEIVNSDAGWVGDPQRLEPKLRRYQVTIASRNRHKMELAYACLRALEIRTRRTASRAGTQYLTIIGRENLARLHDSISAKVSDARKAKRLAALASVGPRDRPRVSDELRQRIVSMRARGMSLRAIAATLEDEGAPTARGGRWHASTIARVLNKEAES